VLYAATEGVSPFRRSNTPATLQSVLNAAPAPPASAQGPLAEAINGLLDKDPARRPDAARVRVLLEAAANPPATRPTQVVQALGQGGGGRGIRLGRRTWSALGAAIVAAAVTAYLVIANPFAGPLPEGWEIKQEKDLAASLAVPVEYQRTVPDRESDQDHWVRYTDWSGSIWIGLTLEKKAEDTGGNIAGSAAAEMYDDDTRFKESGSYELDMDEGPKKTDPRGTTYRDKEAARNTVPFETDDSEDPRPREVQIFYYRTPGGDMYKLTVSYPGKGDFTARGREVASAAITNLDIDKT
jgi:hypothetical protein